MRRYITIIGIVFGNAISLHAQNDIITSRVQLSEKQNKPAAAIPDILLKAYSKGDINAYYPKDMERVVSYPQFLNHFGMEARAYNAISNDKPAWFCKAQNEVKVDPYALKCMSYEFEIGERSIRNHITYQQEIKMVYVKVIYSSTCTSSGLEKEGPVFRMKDIRKLKDKEYKIVNAENSAMNYKVADYLDLRLFRAVK